MVGYSLRQWRNVAGVLCIVGVLCMAVACTRPTTPHGSATSGGNRLKGRVTTTSTGLVLDGSPWWPSGFNAYQLGTDWSINVGCGAMVDLDDYFGKLPPRALTRFNLYSAFAVHRDSGLLDFSRLDAVFAAAERHHQMVLPVLAGSSGDCEDEKFKDRSWYESRWRTARGPGGVTYSDWVTTAVDRWKGSPVIAGWEPVGEPEASICGPAGCHWHDRLCPPGGAEVLRHFFDAVGAQLRAIDPDRPIFSGFVGGDQCGLAGAEFARVAGSDGLDVLDFHDYSVDGAAGPAGSDLPARLAQARELGKPLVVNEIGINAGSCRGVAQRAQMFRSRLENYRSAGVAGALLWAFVPDPRPDECTFDIGPDDPAWDVVDKTIT
ncbi:beta-mannosidase [Gordonia sp. NPDC003429]